MRQYSPKIDIVKPTMLFIGVSTHKSFINEVFYDWLHIIKRDGELIGVNLDINCKPLNYLDICSFIRANELVLGSLVTTHKVNLYNAAKDLFDYLPRTCNEFEEIGCIYKNNGKLCGEVTDLFSVKNALGNILPENYLSTSPIDFCILGSGGAGLALAYRILIDENQKLNRLVITDVSKERIIATNSILKKYDKRGILELFLVKNNDTDNIIRNLRQGSVIVNATGLGKDRPGAPFTENVDIPYKCFIWDFNYRGALDFLKIATAQQKRKQLIIHDGWRYFINGWMQVISRVFNVENIETYFDQFLQIAEAKR